MAVYHPTYIPLIYRLYIAFWEVILYTYPPFMGTSSTEPTYATIRTSKV